ncbi:hypothetical protein NYP20_06580 [Pseudomonas sp. N3-W]|uniref:Uncharacterized protein n=1 Tax=Pseudomonas fungipugnans TaxID=3024217 RepID=A0ABT6QU08_9PSED|nr:MULTISPECIES: hypothetical protein [unclassified Pseudomonas]MDI2594240.1 hypothetical protein [Pseudomonas sp. 681]UWF50627.1 hypothetical protein NYP20_06580 [Pseudomonas sp. N3-W]
MNDNVGGLAEKPGCNCVTERKTQESQGMLRFQAISQLTARRNSVFFFQNSDTLRFCPLAPASQANNWRSTLYRYSCRGHFPEGIEDI